MTRKMSPGCKCCKTGCIYIQDDIDPTNYPGPYPQSLDVGIWEVHSGTWQVANTYTTVLDTSDSSALVTLRQPIAELPAQVHGWIHWNPFSLSAAEVGLVWGFLDDQNYYYVTAQWTHTVTSEYRVIIRVWEVIGGVPQQLAETFSSNDPFEGNGINLYVFWDGTTAWVSWRHDPSTGYSGDPLANAPAQFMIVTPSQDTLGKRIGYISKVGHANVYFTDGIGTIDTYKSQRLQGGAASYVGNATKCIYREGCEYFSDDWEWGPYSVSEMALDEVYEVISGPWEVFGTPGSYSLECFESPGVLRLRHRHPKATKYWRLFGAVAVGGVGAGEEGKARICWDMLDENNYHAIEQWADDTGGGYRVIRRVSGAESIVPLTDIGPGSGTTGIEVCHGSGGSMFVNLGQGNRAYSATSALLGHDRIGFANIGSGNFASSFIQWLRHPDQPDAEPQFPDACGGCSA